MGEEVAKSNLTASDASAFRRRLKTETALFAKRFAGGAFAEDPWRIGCELEICIVGDDFRPIPRNAEIIAALEGGGCGGRVVPELAKFNAELTTPHYAADGDCVRELSADLAKVWKNIGDCAKAAGARVLLCGILPTAVVGDFSRSNMSKSARYRALDAQLMRMRGRAIEINIQGREHLRVNYEGAMLESLTTSLQVHLQIPASAAAAVYNASLAACAPLIALSANSPFALGRDLWAESRVPLFEQAVDTRDAAETRAHERRRVFLGDYADSPAACFAENLEYQPIVPPPPGNPPAEKFRHLRLHNGTIWRWVRPLLGENGDGEKTHIRIEHRVMPAGPTIADVAANIALCLGLIRGLWREGEIAGRLGAAECRENFYSAARDGLSAAVRWPDSQGELREEFASDLARERWLPLAREGLRDLEINDAVLDIVAARAAAGQNGAIWQRRFIAKHGADFARLTAAYMENSEKETPVYRWPI